MSEKIAPMTVAVPSKRDKKRANAANGKFLSQILEYSTELPFSGLKLTMLFGFPFIGHTLLGKVFIFSRFSEGLLFFPVLCGLFIGYSLFTKKEKLETETITARCGAVCSSCSYFVEGTCFSCPGGDPRLREKCPIFSCASSLETSCFLCSKLLRCETYSNRELCPFERDLFPLKTGMGYLMYEKNAEKSVRIFKEYVNRGDFGLLVSRRYPEQIQIRHHLKNVSHIWLTTAEGEETWIDPCNLSKLHHNVSDFMRNTPVSIILFEGFEYLMVRNSFLTALRFIQSLVDEVALEKSRVILSINPEAFDKKELALIRREFTEIR